MECNNCGDKFDPSKDGLVTTHAGKTAAAVCGGCCRGVAVAKIVVRDAGGGAFRYDQFTALEMARKVG